jgi:hypothetical protein
MARKLKLIGGSSLDAPKEDKTLRNLVDVIARSNQTALSRILEHSCGPTASFKATHDLALILQQKMISAVKSVKVCLPKSYT